MPILSDLIERRITRRAALSGLAALAASLTARCAMPLARPSPSSLTFRSLKQAISERDAVADGYARETLIRWGDPVLPGAPAFDAMSQHAAAQESQFGYNNDYVAYFPLARGSKKSDRGLLFVSHEYTSCRMMLPQALREGDAIARVGVEKAAHGGSVLEIAREGGSWRIVANSAYARRITADTKIALTGPAAGHWRLGTSEDPRGRAVRGMIGNCGGGRTPWGTVLSAEENFQSYFANADKLSGIEVRNAKRMGVEDEGGWHEGDARFDVVREPHEMNRFGWVVEIDPYDPVRMPAKRTALGRFSHEAANVSLAADGRAVVYLGDDSSFEYVYRFVSRRKVDFDNPRANWGLLDEGTLSVARFDENNVTWIPLVYGSGPLTKRNDFRSQADVLIEARRAADLLGATKMDRPEDIEENPANGRVYVVLTNNRSRETVDPANPRAANRFGHILEMLPPVVNGKPDHAAEHFAWNVFVLAGDPSSAHPESDALFGMPDNCAFDPQGRLWLATDKSHEDQLATGWPDGIYGCDVSGPGRALFKLLYAVPAGAEACGPEFTPDGTTLFVAIQHPGDGKDANFENPTTRWPDFGDAPPRPSVVAIRRKDDGPIGG